MKARVGNDKEATKNVSPGPSIPLLPSFPPCMPLCLLICHALPAPFPTLSKCLARRARANLFNAHRHLRPLVSFFAVPGRVPAQALNALWNSLSEEELAFWEKKKREDAERYRREMSAWRAAGAGGCEALYLGLVVGGWRSVVGNGQDVGLPVVRADARP